MNLKRGGLGKTLGPRAASASPLMQFFYVGTADPSVTSVTHGKPLKPQPSDSENCHEVPLLGFAKVDTPGSEMRQNFRFRKRSVGRNPGSQGPFPQSLACSCGCKASVSCLACQECGALRGRRTMHIQGPSAHHKHVRNETLCT